MISNIVKIAAVVLSVSGVAAFAGSTTSPASGMNKVSSEMTESGFLLSNGIEIPSFDAAEGRKIYGEKGCAVCHAINGIGGDDAPDLTQFHKEKPMNAFDFAAKMWRGAPAMIAMQEDEIGAQIEFTGDQLADIIAFIHTPAQWAKFSVADLSPKIKKIIEKDGNLPSQKQN